MSKGLGAILSTGDSISAKTAQELQIVPGAVLTEQLQSPPPKTCPVA
jgi:hypothetical protein